MKTIQVSDATHRLLAQRKLDQRAASLDEVLQGLLGQGSRRSRLRTLGPALDAVLERHAVARLRIFGSAARAKDGPTSDLDLLVDFKPRARPGLFGLAELAEDLEALVGSRVDLTTENGLHPRLRKAILAEAEVVWPA